MSIICPGDSQFDQVLEDEIYFWDKMLKTQNLVLVID